MNIDQRRENGSIPGDSVARQGTANSTKPPRLTKEAKTELWGHFDGPPPYPRNKTLPRKGTNSLLDEIISKHQSLTRPKASGQLRQWKLQKYEHTRTVLDASPDDIRERINDALSMTPEDLVRRVLLQMTEVQPSALDDDDDRLFRILAVQQPKFLPILKKMAELPDANIVIKELSHLVNSLTDLAAESFPKSARMLSDAECDFHCERKKREMLIVNIGEKLSAEKQLPLSDNPLSKREARSLFLFTSKCIFRAWARGSVDEDIPAIVFPGTNLVSKYAANTVYYSGSWTLSRALKALTVAEAKRGPYQQFAMAHQLSAEQAISDGLPTYLVDQRGGRFFRASKEYYEFICSVESVYIANLNLKMMLAYSDGSLCQQIQHAIIENDGIKGRFAALAQTASIHDEKVVREVFVYLMQRFVNMRGRWFVKIMKGHQGGRSMLEKAATRKKVSAHVACSEAVATAKREQGLYQKAEKNLIDAAADDDAVDAGLANDVETDEAAEME